MKCLKELRNVIHNSIKQKRLSYEQFEIFRIERVYKAYDLPDLIYYRGRRKNEAIYLHINSYIVNDHFM